MCRYNIKGLCYWDIVFFFFIIGVFDVLFYLLKFLFFFLYFWFFGFINKMYVFLNFKMGIFFLLVCFGCLWVICVYFDYILIDNFVVDNN